MSTATDERSERGLNVPPLGITGTILHAALALSICMKVRDDCAKRPLAMLTAAAGHNIACHAGIKYNDICMKVRASDDEQ